MVPGLILINHIEFSNMALEFLNGGQLDRAINSTYILLIPKIKNPMDVGDY